MQTDIAVLSANLAKFDKDSENAIQERPEDIEIVFHKFHDKNFPPIAGLTPRMQYRICKLFGWQMFPGYDYYLWMDGSMSIHNPKTVITFLELIKDNDMVIFKHPVRKTIKEEVDYIEWKLSERNMYMSQRYQHGLHKEQYEECMKDPDFRDTSLYASTVFMYRNTKRVQEAMKTWWYYQSRYWTCDQVVLPYVIHKHELSLHVIQENVFNNQYVKVTSKHT